MPENIQFPNSLENFLKLPETNFALELIKGEIYEQNFDRNSDRHLGKS